MLFTFISNQMVHSGILLQTPPVPPVVCVPELVVQHSTQLPGLLARLVDDVRMLALKQVSE